MNENPLNLTDEQITAVLDLGGKELDLTTIPEDVLADLVQLPASEPCIGDDALTSPHRSS